MSGLDVEHLRTWIGSTEVRSDGISAGPAEALAAILDRDAPGLDDTLPPTWHWAYFLPHARSADLGPDGHPRLGGFLPPVPLPRRMWAGGRLKFTRPLRIGETAERWSEVADVTIKEGRSGLLGFVLVKHEYSTADGVAVLEEHDIVYRESPPADASVPASQQAPAQPQWSRTIEPDPVLLFRYSAVTFNGHRIHYDRAFCREEGYPGLVVHGPLVATLLLDLLNHKLPDAALETFSFRAVSPLFDTEPFTLHGRVDGNAATLWALNSSGALAISAEAELDLA